MPEGLPLLRDRAYEGDETRQLVTDLEMEPVVRPKSNRLDPWDYNEELYKNVTNTSHSSSRHCEQCEHALACSPKTVSWPPKRVHM